MGDLLLPAEGRDGRIDEGIVVVVDVAVVVVKEVRVVRKE